MHRSRLYGVLVDAPLVGAAEATNFWADALGAAQVRDEEDGDYVGLYGSNGDVSFFVQAVDDAPRYHLDIETDDVEAEVARLTALGAQEHQRHTDWVVLRAPGGGHLFCVVPVQSRREFFDANARTWEGQ